MPDCHNLMRQEFAKAGYDIGDPKVAALIETVFRIHDDHMENINDFYEGELEEAPCKTLRAAAKEFPSYTRDMVSRGYVVEWLNARALNKESCHVKPPSD